MNPFGTVNAPDALSRFGNVNTGLTRMVSIILYLMIVAGGIYALFNFVLAGYGFLSAGDDPKKIQAAWAKIYQSIMGLIFMASAYVIAAIVGRLIFGNWTFILQPQLPTI